MDVKTFTPRESLNAALDHMDSEQLVKILQHAQAVLDADQARDQVSSISIKPSILCPIWELPEEDEAWSHL